MSWSGIVFLSLGFTDLLCKLLFLSVISSEPVSSAPLFAVLFLFGALGWLLLSVWESRDFLQVSFQWSGPANFHWESTQSIGIWGNILVSFYQNKVDKENISTASLHLNNSALPLSFTCAHLTLISSDSSPAAPVSKTFHGPRALAMTFLGCFFLLMQISAYNATSYMNFPYKPSDLCSPLCTLIGLFCVWIFLFGCFFLGRMTGCLGFVGFLPKTSMYQKSVGIKGVWWHPVKHMYLWFCSIAWKIFLSYFWSGALLSDQVNKHCYCCSQLFSNKVKLVSLPVFQARSSRSVLGSLAIISGLINCA